MTDVDTIEVHARVTMTTASLQTIVATAKAAAGKDERGRYRVDTADMVNRMVSRFLLEKGFEAWVQDEANYPPPTAQGEEA